MTQIIRSIHDTVAFVYYDIVINYDIGCFQYNTYILLTLVFHHIRAIALITNTKV